MYKFSPSPSAAFLFLMVSLLFGLPLLIAYTFIDSAFYLFALIPYLIATVSITLLLLLLSRGKMDNSRDSNSEKTSSLSSALISRLNSVSSYFLMGLATVMVLFYSAMHALIFSAYPEPPPSLANLFGAAYIILLVPVSVLIFAKIIYRAFPVVAVVLNEKRYALTAIVLSLSFAVVYLLLVEQIVIIGYNEPFALSPPAGTRYPFSYIFTVGPSQLLISAIYIPYVLVQVSPLITIMIIPFELIFATILSLLTSTTVVLAYYLVRNSGLKCCTRGAVMSTSGSILGLTATCPTCLVPSFVSVIFGGITVAGAAYSNVYGAVLPPILSVSALFLSLLYLSRKVQKETNIFANR